MNEMTTQPGAVNPAPGQVSASTPTPTPAPAPAPAPAPTRDIQVRGLVKTYMRGQVEVPALAGVDLNLPAGSQTAVMGPSGSGKTTLLHCIAGILPPTSGQILLGDRDIAGMNERERSDLRLEQFGFVFQDGQLLGELSNEENVALPLMLAGTPRTEAVARADQLLTQLGLPGVGTARPGQLSGGQAQRVAIARALAPRPSVVFADEPTGALDQATGHEVMQVLTEACRAAGATLVVVTHDVGVASWLHTRLDMRDGHIVGLVRNTAATPATPAAPASQEPTR